MYLVANQCDKIEVLSHHILFLTVHLKINIISNLFPIISFQVKSFKYKGTPISNLVSNTSSSPAGIVQPAWKIQMGH